MTWTLPLVSICLWVVVAVTGHFDREHAAAGVAFLVTAAWNVLVKRHPGRLPSAGLLLACFLSVVGGGWFLNAVAVGIIVAGAGRRRSEEPSLPD